MEEEKEGDIGYRWVIMRNNRGNWVAAVCEVIRPPSLLITSASLGVPKTTLSFNNFLEVPIELTESCYGLLQ